MGAIVYCVGVKEFNQTQVRGHRLINVDALKCILVIGSMRSSSSRLLPTPLSTCFLSGAASNRSEESSTRYDVYMQAMCEEYVVKMIWLYRVCFPRRSSRSRASRSSRPSRPACAQEVRGVKSEGSPSSLAQRAVTVVQLCQMAVTERSETQG